MRNGCRPARSWCLRAIPQGTHPGGGTTKRSFASWDEIRAEHVERAGGEAAVEVGKRELLAKVIGHRLAEVRRARGMPSNRWPRRWASARAGCPRSNRARSPAGRTRPVRRRARGAPAPGDLRRRRRHRRHHVIGFLHAHGLQLVAMHDTVARHLGCGRGAPVISASW